MTHPQGLVQQNLTIVLSELVAQPAIAAAFGPGEMPYSQWVELLREWIEDAREYGIAYESIVAGLEAKPFVLTGRTAVKLLEVGLTLGYKTDRVEDAAFNRMAGGVN